MRRLTFTMFFLLTMLAVAPAMGGTLVVLLNAKRPEADVTLADIRRVYNGEMRYWKDRTPIRPVLPPRRSEAYGRFLRGTLQQTAEQFNRAWEARRFRGDVSILPVATPSDEAAIRSSSTNPSFFVVLDRDALSSLDEKLLRTVKVITVNGKTPDNPQYPLQ